jgi:hypothetical protein
LNTYIKVEAKPVISEWAPIKKQRAKSTVKDRFRNEKNSMFAIEGRRKTHMLKHRPSEFGSEHISKLLNALTPNKQASKQILLDIDPNEVKPHSRPQTGLQTRRPVSRNLRFNSSRLSELNEELTMNPIKSEYKSRSRA